MKSVSKFKQLSRDALVANKFWRDLEKQVKFLAKHIKTIGNPSKTLKTEFDKAKASAVGVLIYFSNAFVPQSHSPFSSST
jgi:hypothetical protein